LLDPELVIRETSESIFRDQVIPLVAHTADTFNIEARLQRDDVAGLEDLVALRDEVGWLGMTQAQPVP
jgi:hypothetical protein